jgi:hypothetical protein
MYTFIYTYIYIYTHVYIYICICVYCQCHLYALFHAWRIMCFVKFCSENLATFRNFGVRRGSCDFGRAILC